MRLSIAVSSSARSSGVSETRGAPAPLRFLTGSGAVVGAGRGPVSFSPPGPTQYCTLASAGLPETRIREEEQLTSTSGGSGKSLGSRKGGRPSFLRRLYVVRASDRMTEMWYASTMRQGRGRSDVIVNNAVRICEAISARRG